MKGRMSASFVAATNAASLPPMPCANAGSIATARANAGSSRYGQAPARVRCNKALLISVLVRSPSQYASGRTAPRPFGGTIAHLQNPGQFGEERVALGRCLAECRRALLIGDLKLTERRIEPP